MMERPLLAMFSSASSSSSSSSSSMLLRVFCRSTAAFGLLHRPRRQVRLPHTRARPCCSSSSSSSLSLESLERFSRGLQEEEEEDDDDDEAGRKHQSQVPSRRRNPSTRRSAGRAAAGLRGDEAGSSFGALPLSAPVKESLERLKLGVPTEVQSAAIPVLLGGEDAAIQSFTGSGKTLAYLLPILSRVGPLKQREEEDGYGASKRSRSPSPSPTSPTLSTSPTPTPSLSPSISTPGRRGIEAVIIAPSRELAMQIVRECERVLGIEHRKAVQQLVGGANRSRQDEGLRRNKPSIVVGTPGRISEISRDGKLHTHSCRFLVLDEADELLSIQFRDDMRRILEHVGRRRSQPKLLRRSPAEDGNGNSNSNRGGDGDGDGDGDGEERVRWSSEAAERVERQTILVSATMPSAVLRAAAEWGQSPVLIKGKSVVDLEGKRALDDDTGDDTRGVKESLPPSLRHFYAISKPQHKVDMARKCIHATGARSVIVFMNHPRRLKDAVFKLEARGIVAAPLHGELSKLERTNTLAAFRNGKIMVLVTSEVGARGLDVPDCDLVINLELPTDMTHYAHRAGRTGRIGRKGTVVSICGETEAFVVKKFQRQLGIRIEQCELVKGGLVPSSTRSDQSEMPALVKA